MKYLQLIEQYALGAMNDAEKSDFEKLLEQNAELAAEWAEYQFIHQGFKQANTHVVPQLDALRTKLRQEGFFEAAKKQVEAELAAEQTAPIEQSPSKGKPGIAFGLIIGIVIGLLGLVVWFSREKDDPSRLGVNGSGVSANTTSIDSVPGQEPNTAPSAAATSFSYQTLSGAFITLEVDRYQGAVALKSAGIKNAQRPAKPAPALGFVCLLEGKRYVVTAADNVYGASFEWGGVLGTDSNGQTFRLKYLGSDAFYNLAVLEMPQSSGWSNPVLHWKEQSFVTKGSKLTALEVSKTNEPAVIEMRLKALRNMGWTADISPKRPLMNALPVFDATGNIVGLVNHITQSAFSNGTQNKKHISGITNTFALRILYSLIHPQQSYEPYFGLVFEQFDAKVLIRAVLPGSPASPYEANLKGIRVDSLQGQPVKDLSDILMYCQNIRPRTQVRISGKDKNGKAVRIEIFAKEMNEQYLGVIGADIINSIQGFRMMNDVGYPKTEYKGAALKSGVYYLYGAGADREQTAYNIGSLPDLGLRLRAVSLQKNGYLLLMSDHGDDEPKYFPIQFENPLLWQ